MVLFMLFDNKSRREEQWLKAKLSDYPAYQERVGKLISFVYLSASGGKRSEAMQTMLQNNSPAPGRLNNTALMRGITAGLMGGLAGTIGSRGPEQ
jgi:hypothetical protein